MHTRRTAKLNMTCRDPAEPSGLEISMHVHSDDSEEADRLRPIMAEVTAEDIRRGLKQTLQPAQSTYPGYPLQAVSARIGGWPQALLIR